MKDVLQKILTVMCTTRMPLVILLFLVTSCEDDIYPKDLETAKKLCADRGGWVRIDPWSVGHHTVSCHDGTSYNLSKFGIKDDKK